MSKISDEDIQKFKQIWEEGNFEIHIRDLKIFCRRSSNGMILGYQDESLRRHEDDHWTFLISNDDITSVHRTERTQDGKWYTKINWDYISNPKGYRKCFQEIINSDAPVAQKIVLVPLYFGANALYNINSYQSYVIYNKEEAKIKGLSNHPVFYIQIPTLFHYAFKLYVRSIRRLNKLKYNRIEQNYPGLQQTFKQNKSE